MRMVSETSPLLDIREISKQFPGVRALDSVSLTLDRGEVLAIIGENGAGKSSLMKILAGIQKPTSGQLWVDGIPLKATDVKQALNFGISLIHQELNLAENLDVGANMFLGREPSHFGVVDKTAIANESQKYLQQVGFSAPTDTLVGDLPIGEQQLVEIAKSLSMQARVLIMDEPTSSLTARETRTLLQLVHQLRKSGVGVIYISHRLDEVEELADRVVVLRDGAKVGELSKSEIDRDVMVSMMVGRKLATRRGHNSIVVGSEVLATTQLKTPAHPQHAIDLSVRAGEIVGIAGLVGSGRTELLTTLFGMTPAVSGSLRIGDLTRPPRSPRAAIHAGIMLVPEDRRLAGLVLSMTVKHNLSLPSLSRDCRYGTVNQSAENRIVQEMFTVLRIKARNDNQIAGHLSGGNQQKVVLGKWLAMRPKLLLLDEPTRGVDVGAKEEIYQLMRSLSDQGFAILFASSELEEILALADRVLVMREGKMVGELPREQQTEESIMQLATGEQNMFNASGLPRSPCHTDD